MIICHDYKYIFISIPHTASTMLEKELCNYYGGEKIRYKHSLPAFISRKHKDYFIIGGVRDPVNDLYTQYYKYKNDHLGIYTAQVSGTASFNFMSAKSKKLFKLVHERGMTLEEYIKAQTSIPYVPKIEFSYDKYDFVYKIENIHQDFDQILKCLNLSKVRELPVANKTKYREGRNLNSFEHFSGLKVARVKHGYSEVEISKVDRFLYFVTCLVKSRYWYLKELQALIKNLDKSPSSYWGRNMVDK